MRQGRAYKLFVEETAKDLASAQQMLASPAQLTAEQIVALSIIFHKLRGAAGFLQFPEIAALAAQAEQAARDTDVTSAEQVMHLSGLFDRLRDLCALQIRPPSD